MYYNSDRQSFAGERKLEGFNRIAFDEVAKLIVNPPARPVPAPKPEPAKADSVVFNVEADVGMMSGVDHTKLQKGVSEALTELLGKTAELRFVDSGAPISIFFARAPGSLRFRDGEIQDHIRGSKHHKKCGNC